MEENSTKKAEDVEGAAAAAGPALSYERPTINGVRITRRAEDLIIEVGVSQRFHAQLAALVGILAVLLVLIALAIWGAIHDVWLNVSIPILGTGAIFAAAMFDRIVKLLRLRRVETLELSATQLDYRFSSGREIKRFAWPRADILDVSRGRLPQALSKSILPCPGLRVLFRSGFVMFILLRRPGLETVAQQLRTALDIKHVPPRRFRLSWNVRAQSDAAGVIITLHSWVLAFSYWLLPVFCIAVASLMAMMPEEDAPSMRGASLLCLRLGLGVVLGGALWALVWMVLKRLTGHTLLTCRGAIVMVKEIGWRPSLQEFLARDVRRFVALGSAEPNLGALQIVFCDGRTLTAVENYHIRIVEQMAVVLNDHLSVIAPVEGN